MEIIQNALQGRRCPEHAAMRVQRPKLADIQSEILSDCVPDNHQEGAAFFETECTHSSGYSVLYSSLVIAARAQNITRATASPVLYCLGYSDNSTTATISW
jgi:hypothetical protein